MKVAFCIRPDYLTVFGGDSVQCIKTKENLENNFDVKIDIIVDPTLITKEYDLVHIFNFATVNITQRFYERSLELNLPIFASSIYWDYSFISTSRIAKVLGIRSFITNSYMNRMLFLIKIIVLIFNKPQNISKRFSHNLKYFIKKATCVLPNSSEEAYLLLSFTKLDSSLFSNKFRVILNSVEFCDDAIEISKSEFLTKWNIPDNYILQVGRVEYTKNQLNLITALMDRSDIPIVFVGKVGEIDYYESIKKIAETRGNVYFIDFVPHEEISTFYKYAKLHVLLSLRESPGLVNLEALKNGCPIVIPDQRFLPVDTYFSGQPYIVDPFDLVNVKQTVLEAYEKGARIKLDVEKFSWKNTSKDTYSAYIEFTRK